jgi:hypothetical protein
MNSYDADNDAQIGAGRRQLGITAQLYRAASSMRHIDEVFTWLAHAVVQVFDVQAVQWWAIQSGRANAAQLRSMICQDSSLPHYILTNDQMIATVEYLQNAQTSFFYQEVNRLFTPYQATLLTRYRLNYCACYFIRNPALLLPAPAAALGKEPPLPLAVSALLFMARPLSQESLSGMDLIFEQVIPIATKRGLLVPARGLASASASSARQASQLDITQLIPRRHEDAALLKSSNPLAGGVRIGDRQARRLYGAIDGQKNFGELCTGLNLDWKEGYRALQRLLAEKRIQLYMPDGQAVDSSSISESL